MSQGQRAGGSSGILLAICYLGFVSLGLPDTLIGVAWPSVRETFGLKQSAVSWIFVGSGCSYFLSSFFAGRLLKVFNVGVLLGLSSGLVALSGFNYGFATVWPWFAAGALLHGLGSGAIDSGLNHFVATHFSARHMNWLHASYSLGAMLGPIIVTACIARAGSWRMAYVIVATTLAVLAVLFLVTRSQFGDSRSEAQSGNQKSEVPAELKEALHEPASLPPTGAKETRTISAASALRNRVVQLHILIFFIYTGVEVAIGQWSFTVLREARGLDAEVAGAWVTIYWAAILAGRIIFGFVVDRISIDLLIRLSLVTAVWGACLFAWNPFRESAAVALGLCGLGLAVIFPCLMTRTPQRMGKEIAAHAIGFQVGAAMLGAAALPSFCGVVAQAVGLNLVASLLLGFAVGLLVLHEVLLLMAGNALRQAD